MRIPVMLAYALAIAIALGSFALFMAAFFFPEVHRKYDFFWSGVGFFYALVLWICAGRITGGVLLGQTASVALLGWLGWETLNLRRATTSSDEQTVISPETQKKINRFSPSSLLAPLTSRFGKKSPQPATEPVESVATLVEEAENPDLESLADRIAPPETPATEGEQAEDSLAEAEVAAETELEDSPTEAESIEVPAQSEPKPPESLPEEESEEEIPEIASITVEQAVDPETGNVAKESLEITFDNSEAEETEQPPSETEESEPINPTPPKPPAANLVEAAREQKNGDADKPPTPINEFAPEVDLAPDAEPSREED